MIIDFSQKLSGVKERPDEGDITLESAVLHLLWGIEEKDPAAKRQKFKLASRISTCEAPIDVSDEDRKLVADQAFVHLPTLAAGRISEALSVEI